MNVKMAMLVAASEYDRLTLDAATSSPMKNASSGAFSLGHLFTLIADDRGGYAVGRASIHECSESRARRTRSVLSACAPRWRGGSASEIPREKRPIGGSGSRCALLRIA